MFAIKLSGITAARLRHDPAVVKKAITRSLRRVINSAKSETSTMIRQRFKIKKGDLDPRLSASMRDDETAILVVTGAPIPLVYFNPSQFGGSGQFGRTGTRVNIKSSGVGRSKGLAAIATRYKGRKLGVYVEIEKGKKTSLSHGFLAQMKSGHLGVFRRDSSKKIKEFKVITYSSMFLQPRVLNRVKEKVLTQWDKEFRANLKYYRDQIGR